MSYYTRVEAIYEGQETWDEKFVQDAVAWATADGWHALEVEHLQQVLTGEVALFRGYLDHVVQRFTDLSRHFPVVTFGVRGWGEEFEDVWLSYIKNGRPTRSFEVV